MLYQLSPCSKLFYNTLLKDEMKTRPLGEMCKCILLIYLSPLHYISTIIYVMLVQGQHSSYYAFSFWNCILKANPTVVIFWLALSKSGTQDSRISFQTASPTLDTKWNDVEPDSRLGISSRNLILRNGCSMMWREIQSINKCCRRRFPGSKGTMKEAVKPASCAKRGTSLKTEKELRSCSIQAFLILDLPAFGN